MMKKVADLPIQIDNTSFLLLQKLKRNLKMNEEKSLRQTLVQARVFEEIVRVRNREKVACVCIRVCVCLCVCVDVLMCCSKVARKYHGLGTVGSYMFELLSSRTLAI